MMERSDSEELEPLLKSKSEAKVTTPSTILQKVFCLFLLLFPGKDTKDKINPYAHKWDLPAFVRSIHYSESTGQKAGKSHLCELLKVQNF